MNIWKSKQKKIEKMTAIEKDKCVDIPDNALKALNKCNSALFPNIHSLLITLCTLPFNSVECERNGSALKHISEQQLGKLDSMVWPYCTFIKTSRLIAKKLLKDFF